MIDTQLNTQGARLKEFLTFLNISQKSLSDALNITQPYLSQVLNNSRGLTIKIVTELANCYTSLNIHWLLTGAGEMLLAEGETKKNEVNEKNFNYARGVTVNHQSISVGEVAALRQRIEDLEKRLQDKELIIELLKNKQ